MPESMHPVDTAARRFICAESRLRYTKFYRFPGLKGQFEVTETAITIPPSGDESPELVHLKLPHRHRDAYLKTWTRIMPPAGQRTGRRMGALSRRHPGREKTASLDVLPGREESAQTGTRAASSATTRWLQWHRIICPQAAVTWDAASSQSSPTSAAPYSSDVAARLAKRQAKSGLCFRAAKMHGSRPCACFPAG